MTRGMGLVFGVPRSGVPGRYRGNRRKRVVGRLWPHGAFSVGTCWEGEDAERRAGSNEVLVAEVDPEPGGTQLDLFDPLEDITLPYPSNSHTTTPEPTTYGRKGISRYGQNMIKAGAYLLEERVTRGNLTFLTLTIPPLGRAESRAIASNWGRVLNRMLQWLQRALIRAGVRPWVVVATELQPKRAAKGDAGAIHAHIMFQGRLGRHTDWAIKKAEVKGSWERILSREAGVTVSSSYWPYMRPVRDSAHGYIGKYMSKGVEGIAAFVEENGWECVPRQWWAMTASMRREVRRCTQYGTRTGEALEALVSAYFAGPDKGFPGYLQVVHAIVDGHPVLVGYSGVVRRQEADELRAWLSCIIDGSP